uniref:Uncharacterized protein n=1 Tax=Anguilla anguilla TaxID=7936 RepID=A0A0E9S4G2_ANGAN
MLVTTSRPRICLKASSSGQEAGYT